MGYIQQASGKTQQGLEVATALAEAETTTVSHHQLEVAQAETEAENSVDEGHRPLLEAALATTVVPETAMSTTVIDTMAR